MKENAAIRIRKTIRPMRFMFLVPKNDLDTVKQVIRINTALWGGFYNPIVEIDQNIENILSLFKASHSDVIINFADQHISNSLLDLENYQVIEKEGFDGLLQNEAGKYNFRYGCDIRPLLRFYWKEEGRFQTLTPNTETKSNKCFYVEGENEHWVDYSLLEFGQYPTDHEYDYKSGYQKATNCTTIQLNNKTLPEIKLLKSLTPLIFTLAETQYFYYGAYSRFFNETIIYIGNIDKASDWVEFWNLRCFCSRVTFIHLDDISLFENQIQSISEKPSSKKDSKHFFRFLIQKSASLENEVFSPIMDKIAGIVPGEKIIRDHFPPIGISYDTKKNRTHGPLPIEAPIGKAYEQEDLESLSDGKLEFKVPIPEFLDSYSNESDRSWCTTINGWSLRDNNFWIKIPSLGEIEKELRSSYFFWEGFRISPRENIVLFPRCFSSRPLDIETINLPSHLNILKGIFGGYKIEVLDYSEKGRYALAIEEAAAQGIWFGANILLDRGVQAILYRLSNNNGEMHLPRAELEKIAGEQSLGVREKNFTPAQIINTLIDRKILRIGLELKCNNCYRQGWYHISQFSETFKCLFCFSEQNLPVIDNKEWRYRSSGLFSSQGIGYGSLPVICLNLYLQRRYHSDLRSFYSFNVKFPGGELGEIDAAFIRHEMLDAPELLVCECKSGEAYQEDFDRLEKLCSLIPGTVACLATWKASFSNNEKSFAQNFWDKGYEIIMLTRLDIESKEIAFEGVDNQHKYIHDFVDLAHATRQKYLQ